MDIKYVNIIILIICISISFVILLGCLFDKHYKNKSLRPFLIMCSFLLLQSFFSLLCWWLNGIAGISLLYALNTSNIILSYLFVSSFFYFVIELVNVSKKIKIILLTSFFTIFLFFSVFAVIMCILGQFFYSSGGEFVYADNYLLSQIYPLLVLAFCTLFALFSKIKSKNIIAIITYCILPFIALYFQSIYQELSLVDLASTISLLIIYVTIYIDKSAYILKQKEELTQSRISIMLSQIRPHFIFNTLSSISALCDIDSKQAKQAINDFSKYLRCNLESLSEIRPILFSKELDNIKSYLNLEKQRLGDKLNINYQISSSNFYVPALTIQPLVENAVRIGIAKKDGNGCITISSYEDINTYYISIVDDGIGFDIKSEPDTSRQHIGVKNARDRLKIMLNGTLDIKSEINKGTKVFICLPKNNMEVAKVVDENYSN